MLNINKNLEKIEISIIRKMNQFCSSYQGRKNLINLTVGEPDLKQPEEILNGVIEIIKTKPLGYPPIGGILELKQKIIEFYKNKYDVTLTKDEIIITVGTTEGLSTALKTVILPGDEVLLPLPAYPGYEPIVILNEGIPIKIDTSDNNFELDVEMLKRYITPKTKAIVLNYPINPTGGVISQKNRDDILKFAKENNIYILSDEVYSELTFDGNHVGFLDDRYRENVIVVDGLSKSHSLTGWRVGYLIASEKLTREMIKVHQYTVTASSIVSQYAALVAFNKSMNTTVLHREIYKKRAEIIYSKLLKNGIKALKPSGGIYIFFSIKEFTNLSSLEFAYKLLDTEGVALVPGTAFGIEGYVRISLVKEIEVLEEAIDRVIEFLRTHSSE